MNLVDKYKPKNFADIKGQEMAISKIKSFVKNFPSKKAAILYGPAGSGKTSLAYALARELKAEIIELNASDLRNRDNIDSIVGNSSQQQSLFNKSKVILMDEVDGISGFYDRGGLQELIVLIEQTSFPIIMTANHIWDRKFVQLRKKAEMIELKALTHFSILELLKQVASGEKINLSEDILKSISVTARGDCRAALNDLQGIEDETILLAGRDREESIFNALKQVFKDQPSLRDIDLYDKVNMPIEEVALWLEENIPREYEGADLARAIDILSRADVFKGRIYRQQHWRFLLYQNFLLSYGISACKTKIKREFTSYKRPERILKIWMINQKNLIKKEIAKKYARFCHVSLKRAMREFPLFVNVLKDDNIQRKLKLEQDEVDFLNKVV
jgi:replication factor C large subunit